MIQLPRLAVGGMQPRSHQRECLWALLARLQQDGVDVQSFRSRSCYSAPDFAQAVTGRAQRHLDPWTMSRQRSRELFDVGARDVDVSLVDGAWGASHERLETIAEWLDLPQIAVLDVTQLDACRLPPPPPNVRGVILHRVSDGRSGQAWRLTVETRWRVPVVGVVEQTASLEELTRQIRRLAPGSDPADVHAIVLSCLRPNLDVAQLLALAGSAPPMPDRKQPPSAFRSRPPLIAVAFDRAINGYFPDTFDALEQCGADVQAFSPLHSESVPHDADVVLLGSGPVAEYAPALAANRCLQASLRAHVSRGGRVYAEGGGVAMLSQAVVTSRGAHAMSGALPLVAHAWRSGCAPQPVSSRVGCETWLGPGDQAIRAYRNQRWRFGPVGQLTGAPDRATPRSLTDADWFVHHGVVASRLHVHFAASPEWLAGFLAPHDEESWV